MTIRNTTDTRNPLANSLRQAAERMGLSTNYLRGCIARGELKTVRFGRAIRILEDDLQRFVRQGSQHTTGPSADGS